MTVTRSSSLPTAAHWLGAAHQLVAERPDLAGTGLTDVLPLVVSAA